MVEDEWVAPFRPGAGPCPGAGTGEMTSPAALGIPPVRQPGYPIFNISTANFRTGAGHRHYRLYARQPGKGSRSWRRSEQPHQHRESSRQRPGGHPRLTREQHDCSRARAMALPGPVERCHALTVGNEQLGGLSDPPDLPSSDPGPGGGKHSSRTAESARPRLCAAGPGTLDPTVRGAFLPGKAAAAPP